MLQMLPKHLWQMLQMVKSFAINSLDAKLTESFENLHKNGQEMSIFAKK